MFDIFGEMESAEELNKTAEGLKMREIKKTFTSLRMKTALTAPKQIYTLRE